MHTMSMLRCLPHETDNGQTTTADYVDPHYSYGSKQKWQTAETVQHYRSFGIDMKGALISQSMYSTAMQTESPIKVKYRDCHALN